MTQIIQGQDENMALLSFAAQESLPCLLVGDTGTGKTSAIHQLAKDAGKKSYRINLNGQSNTDELLGKYLLKDGHTEWVDGALTHAARKGYWVILDEINAAGPEVLFALHSLLDDDRMLRLTEKGDSEEVKPHKDFRFFASMNQPTVGYGGVRDLNSAFLSRFPVVTIWNYPHENIETKILQDRTQIDSETALKLVVYANHLRKLYEDEKIMYICSTRDLLSVAFLISKGYALNNAVQTSILNRIFDPTELQLMKKMFTEITKQGFPTAIKKKSIAEIVDSWDKREKDFAKMKTELDLKNEFIDEVAKSASGNKKVQKLVEKIKPEKLVEEEMVGHPVSPTGLTLDFRAKDLNHKNNMIQHITGLINQPGVHLGTQERRLLDSYVMDRPLSTQDELQLIKLVSHLENVPS